MAIFMTSQVAHKSSAIPIAYRAPTVVSVLAYHALNSEAIQQKWLGAGTVNVGRTVLMLERGNAVLTPLKPLKRTPKLYRL